jgi:hypothetical protein
MFISSAGFVRVKKYLKHKILTTTALLLAVSFWFFDSLVHFFIYGESNFELIPAEFNELWMRTAIIVLMVLFGIFADYFTNHISSRDKLLELTGVYNDLLHSNLDVLSNQLEQMKLFRMEAHQSKDFNAEIIALFDNSIAEISELVESLTRVTDVTDTQIKEQLHARESHEFSPRFP